MSTYPSPGTTGNPYDPYNTAPAKKTSGVAIASLICSLCGIVTCGITAVIGVILGLIGLLTIGRNPERKGKGMAAAGLILGIVIAAGWGIGFAIFGSWIGGMVKFAQKGPTEALVAGFNGDVAGFKSHFRGAGSSVSDAEASAFIEELRSRYGVFSGANLPPQGNPPQPAPGQAFIVMPYSFQFSGSSPSGEAELHFADPQTGQMSLNKLGYIHIIDPDKGDLWFPASSAPTMPLPSVEDADEDAEPETPPAP